MKKRIIAIAAVAILGISTFISCNKEVIRYSGEVDQEIPWQTDQPISWRRETKNAVVAFSKLNN